MPSPTSGLWRHAGGLAEPPLSLTDIRYLGGEMTWQAHRQRAPESVLADHLAAARAILRDPPTPVRPPQAAPDLEVGADFQALRWFLMPDEAAEALRA